jgi:hypothetical protein
MLKAGESGVIPRKLIVFVTTAEILRLPFYLVSRFNLKLRLLHEGRLGGTANRSWICCLSCQLHNISSERVCLTSREGFAVIEFSKRRRHLRRTLCYIAG